MKTTFYLLLIVLMPLMAFKSSPVDQAHYGFVFHRGDYTANKTGFVSMVIYKSSACQTGEFWNQAQKKFGKYLISSGKLKPNYDPANAEYMTGSLYGSNGGTSNTTREEWQKEINEHIKREKAAGNTVISVPFSYNCN